MRARLLISACLALLLAGCPGEVPEAGSGDASSSSGAASASQKRIIILTNGNSPYWDACRAGVQQADKDLKLNDSGLSAVLEINDASEAGQLNWLRQFGSQSDVAGVGVCVINADNAAIADEMRNLQKKGVKVVAIDSDVNRKTLRDARFAFIGTDNRAGGVTLGNCAKQLAPEGGGYVTFVGLTGSQNAIDRIEGFGEGAGPSFTSLDRMADNFDATRARENVRNAIQNHGDKLKALVGIYSYNAPAIVDVVREQNARDRYKVACFDAEPGAVQAMQDGMIDALVVQNPYEMGYQGVRLIKALVQDDQATVKEMFPKHGEPDGDIFDTGLKVVVPSDSSPLKADMFSGNTQFLTLDAFREWLNKYGLTGS